MVYFDFTTFHRGSKFIGRSGQLSISTDASLEECNQDLETIQQMCVDYILTNKPKWNILMVNIKSIVPEIKNNQP